MSSLYRISLIWQARPEVHKSSHPAVWNTHELTPISSSSTIRLPHTLAAKGQTHSCHKDFQVLAPVNSSSALSSRITSGGDKTLPARSSGHSPWRHKILSAVVFTCAALTCTHTFLLDSPLQRKGEMAAKTRRWKYRLVTTCGFFLAQ